MGSDAGAAGASDIPAGAAALARLLRLASPTLPVGAYSYSQGLEWAIEAGTVSDPASAQRWIADALRYSLARFEAPVWWRMYHCWRRGDAPAAARWNDMFVASRETSELRAETLQMGGSLRRLLADLDELGPGELDPLLAIEAPAYVSVAAFAAAAWGIPDRAALTGYCWSWMENQVLAAIKAVPLGQLAGQRMLSVLDPVMGLAVDEAVGCVDHALANFAPVLALASTLHETQYSRLFRS
jgi:urease accessory protein